MNLTRIRVVGAGLIGTSIALRLRELGIEVDIDDHDASARGLARDLLGGGANFQNPDLVVIATSPDAILKTLSSEFSRDPQARFIDVGSIKLNLQLEVEEFPELRERFIGTHPIAGREHSGAQSARSDLFDGRAWIITTSSYSSSKDLELVKEFITAMGATPYQMDAGSHDRLMAEISHLPQLLSTALALSLGRSQADIELSGQGLRDMIRLSGSNGKLWREILLSNQAEVSSSIVGFLNSLGALSDAIESKDGAQLEELFNVGAQLYSKLSGKHGARAREYAYVSVVIEDKPGQLGALFNECAAIDANVEDLTLEHSPRQETGLIRLALSQNDAERLAKHLVEKNWRAHLA